MHSSVMMSLITLLLSQGNRINCLKGWGRGERLSEKVITDVLAQVLGFPEVNFCLGIRLQEVTFITRKVFGDSF